MTTSAKLIVFAVAVGLIVAGIGALPAWLWHPLGYCTGTPAAVARCKSYNFWSGVESDWTQIVDTITLIVLALGLWHRVNCHEAGCWWIVRHGKTHCRRHEDQV